MYSDPIVRCGLSSMALRNTQMETINKFQRKILRAFLSLSDKSPIPGIHFIFGEISLEAKIHRDVFSVFFSVLKNPNSKIYQIVKYLLEEAPENSRSWSIYLRNLCELYKLPQPLDMMSSPLMSKESFKTLIMTKITVHHENELRSLACNNSKMKYFNVATRGLTGRHHPVLSAAVTTSEVKALRPVVKMLLSDYFTYSVKDSQSSCGAHCRLCPTPLDQSRPPAETIEHVVTSCLGTAEIRERKLEELFAVVGTAKSPVNCDLLRGNNSTLTQFILDPCYYYYYLLIPL